MEVAQWKVMGYEAAMNASKDAEAQEVVKVKQEQVGTFRRLPAATGEDTDPPHTIRLCNYCRLDHRIPTVCPAQGRICSKCKKPNHFALCRSAEKERGRDHQYQRRPSL